MIDIEAFADKYVALWNEPDPDRRRELVGEVWAADGRHILQPPEEVRTIAAQPGIGLAAVLEAQGHEAIAARVTSAYDHWIASEGLSFRRHDDPDRLGDLVKLHWEALAKDGTRFALGLAILILAGDGRIARDYTFVVG